MSKKKDGKKKAVAKTVKSAKMAKESKTAKRGPGRPKKVCLV